MKHDTQHIMLVFVKLIMFLELHKTTPVHEEESLGISAKDFCTNVLRITLHLSKVKGLDMPPFTGKPQFEVAMTLGGAVQVAAAHCPNKRTLAPQCAAITDPASCTMAFIPRLGSAIAMGRYSLTLSLTLTITLEV